MRGAGGILGQVLDSAHRDLETRRPRCCTQHRGNMSSGGCTGVVEGKGFVDKRMRSRGVLGGRGDERAIYIYKW